MSVRLLDKLTKAKSLPLGHVELEALKALLEREYSACREIESLWMKRFRQNRVSLPPQDEALEYCQALLAKIGERKLRGIIWNDPKVHKEVEAHYYRGKISFKGNYSFRVLIHELAHHCDTKWGHGEEYCECLNFLFAVAYSMSGKKLKKKWVDN